MSKKIKEFELNALRNSLGGVRDFVALEPMKVDSATEYEFRKKLRLKNIKVQLVKNSFAQKVFAEGGIQSDSTWVGATLVCWGAESVKALATSVDQAVKEARKDPKAPEKFKVKTAVADGQTVAFEVAKTLPTRKEAIGDVLAAILGAGGAVVGCLTGPASQIVGCVSAVEEKNKDATPTPAA
ncbi:MAG TPA: 50S ribosomal protein L10 [Fimbriiglobus sp.]|jgi:ribosomal protein L10